MARKIIAVIGIVTATKAQYKQAREVGRLIAQAGYTLITGGLGGVMEAASQGAKEAGGLVLGLIPGSSPKDANAHVDIAIVTAMGDARNAIIANTADVFIAIGRGLGTLSEVAFVLKRKKPLISLDSWSEIEGPDKEKPLIAKTSEEAMGLAVKCLTK